jgi:hypothetical protein
MLMMMTLAKFSILNPMQLHVNWSAGAKGSMKDNRDCVTGVAQLV